MTPEQMTKLRTAFPAGSVGKLPKVTCYQCSQNKGTCDRHPQKQKCAECGNYLSPAHLHLDFVGHAACTQRLLEVDPEWSWEPVAFGPDGLPARDQFGGLWIRLTVCGVTRLGYGDAMGKPGPSAVKEAIGDAIRNAAMRFGVALDLWAKEDISVTLAPTDSDAADGGEAPAASAQADVKRRNRMNSPDAPITDAQMKALQAAMNGHTREQRLAIVATVIGREVGSATELTQFEASRVIDHVKAAS